MEEWRGRELWRSGEGVSCGGVKRRSELERMNGGTRGFQPPADVMAGVGQKQEQHHSFAVLRRSVAC